MVSTMRTLQLLFAAALTLLLFSTLSGGGSDGSGVDTGSHMSAVHKVFSGEVHISKLWPWSSKGSSSGSGRAWIREHLERSERIYQTMVAQRHELDDDFKAVGAKKDLFPCVGHGGYISTPFTIWDYTTAAFNCPHSVQRIGRLGDGGKWICGLEVLEAVPAPSSAKTPKSNDKDESAAKCIIYSFGINTESSFEDALLSRTEACEIWGYDFSVDDFGPQLDRTAGYAHRAHFHKQGIAGVTDDKKNPPFYSIQDLLKRNGHDHIDVLKMDIEGFEFDTMLSIIDAFRMPKAGAGKAKSNGKAKGHGKHSKAKPHEARREGDGDDEYDEDEEYEDDNETRRSNALSALEDDGLGEVPIAQVMIEIHLDPGRIPDTPAFMGWWQALEEAGFRATWTEPNLLVSTIPLYDAYPRYAEYTFINIKDSKSKLLK